MTSPLEQIADATLSRSPVQRYFHRRAADRLTVLAYHEVEDAAAFEEHARYIREALHPVTIADVAAAVEGRRGLPQRAVLITFDDGHRSVYEAGLPILQRYELPAVVFVVAGLIDTDEPFWWDEVKALAAEGGRTREGTGRTPQALARSLKYVSDDQRLRAIDELRRTAAAPAPAYPQLRRHELRELESAGVAVGNHTLTHPCLSACSDDKIIREVQEADRLLTDMLGHAPLAFAYPNGDEDERVVRAVGDAGYRAAFLFDHRLSEVPPRHPLRISRVRISADASVDRLRIIASGLHPALLRLRHRGAPAQQAARPTIA